MTVTQLGVTHRSGRYAVDRRSFGDGSGFLVVIYRRYIAQCRLKSVGFTTSRKTNSDGSGVRATSGGDSGGGGGGGLNGSIQVRMLDDSISA